MISKGHPSRVRGPLGSHKSDSGTERKALWSEAATQPCGQSLPEVADCEYLLIDFSKFTDVRPWKTKIYC